MRARSLAIATGVLAVLVLGVAGCGDGSDSASSNVVKGNTLTIYSSMPLQGDSRPQSEDVVAGERLALEDAGSKVNDFAIKFVSLDDATPAAGKWDPGQVSTNAHKAAQDPTTIAYIGEFNSGASAISIPILNQAGILQVSPSNVAVGLTKAAGADTGEPDKYYPTKQRTFARVVPADNVQAAAQAAYMKDNGVTKLFIVNDGEVYGAGLATNVAAAAKEAGIAVAGNEAIDPKADDYRELAATIKASGADAMFFGGITQNNAVQLWRDVHVAAPQLKLFGPDGLAESTFFARIGPSAEKPTFITSPTLDPKLYPPAGQQFFKRFKDEYGRRPEPYAIYGYEAMASVLDAIKRAGDKGNDRSAVIDSYFDTADRESILGTYSIDADGDTSLTDYGGYRVEDGKLVFDKVIRAPTG